MAAVPIPKGHHNNNNLNNNGNGSRLTYRQRMARLKERRRRAVIDQIGLTFLSIGTAYGIWSAWNPSYFTIAKFAGTPEDLQNIKFGMNSAALISAIASAGIGLGFGKRGVPAAVAGALTTGTMYGVYTYKIRQIEAGLVPPPPPPPL